MTDETHLKVLRLVDQNPHISQRELARELGISLGKTNYCLRALLDKGWVKINNFRNSDNKLRYAYLLTPSGVENKARLTMSYLKIKMDEYERLRREIAELKKDTNTLGN